jgi:sugar lactone lactonase YvrE
MTTDSIRRTWGSAALGLSLAGAISLLVAGCGDDSTGPQVEEVGRLYNVAGIADEPGGGRDGQVATASRLYWPQDLVMNAAGELLIADWNNHLIRAVSPDGKIRRIMGSGNHGDDSNGPALQINLNHPDGIAIGPDGNIYVSGWHNWKVKKCDVSTMMVTSVVGNDNGFGGDGGLAIDAAISLPSGTVWDGAGNLYVSDQGNNRIRRVDAVTGIITTFAGGAKGFADGTGGDAHFAFPNGTDAYPGGRADLSADGLFIYVADTENHRVRKIEIATQVVTTIGGDGTGAYTGDGGPATAARFNYPTDIACTPEGDIFVADAKNHVIRKIDADGIVTTVAGTGVMGNSPNGTIATEANLDTPSALYYRAATRTLYISDTYNSQIKKLRLPDAE